MKPFKYSPFPNAQFGIADRLPGPVKGILSREYITNPLTPHLCGVTSTPYEWCQETNHLISGFTKIENYPPRKYIVIKGTASEPTRSAEDWVLDSERSPKKKREKKGGSRAKSSSMATFTSKKRSVVALTFDIKGPTTKVARISQPQRTKIEYTPLGHETIPILISSSCPTNASTIAATSSDLLLLKPKMTITSPIKENKVEEEGPFIVPTPEAGDLDFTDDEFNLDSILSEAQEVFLTAVPNTSSGKLETEGTLSFPSNDNQKENIPIPTPTTTEQGTVDQIVASSEIKAQLLEATTYLNQHASSEVSSLESFMEDLYNRNILLESSSEDLRVATAGLSKHKKDMAKYGADF
ncbi:hypothetical protein PIB30_085595 [Stylosanthes scabra]|uniref:Uncharacterized protein n=1 Tax=Stylosanthes scabra TaxID=79078 RepID=A0ABU6WR81_9FABA|nr:hypothetical protein [Stylosanthes scabra]